MIQPWPTEKSRLLGDYRIFTVHSDTKRSPRTGQALDFFVIKTTDWVNVIAVTPQDELVMVEQYRHGSGTVELEIPGGMIDAHDASPLAAGLRELEEETGYVSTQSEMLGHIFPNPAIMTNTCHTVLAMNCELKGKTALDAGEDVATRLVPLADIPNLVAAGKIQHSLVVVALYYFELWRRGAKSSK